jgi:hypothetical protein
MPHAEIFLGNGLEGSTADPESYTKSDKWACINFVKVDGKFAVGRK